MTFGAMQTRLLQFVEDKSNDVYSADEAKDALNMAKDEVYSLIRSYQANFPEASTTVSFTIGSLTVTLPTDLLELLRIESTDDIPIPYEMTTLQDGEEDKLRFFRDANGAPFLGRTTATTIATSLKVFYVPDFADLTASTSSFGIAIAPSQNGILYKSASILLASRNRAQMAVYWEGRADKIMDQVEENLQKQIKIGPRYVRMV